MPTAKQIEQSDQAFGWLLFAYHKVIRALEADLLDQHNLSLIWFDVMNRLREAPDQRMRMGDLQEASLFTTSGITRLIDRIEAAGFVRRERLVEDRRGIYVAMTRAGNDKINSVWSDHLMSIYKHFGSRLTMSEMQTIERAARKLIGDDPIPTAVPEA